LLELARRLVNALPADVVEEAAVTGSVSRGVADEYSDIEMLLVTTRSLDQEECDALAAAAFLEQRDTWGPQDGPVRRVFGYLDGTPIELIWWSRSFAEQVIESLLAGQVTGSADALVHAVPLRTTGLLESWQARLTPMPDAVAHAVIEDAALMWGGFAPEGFLTIARPGETASRLEHMTGDVGRILRAVYAVNAVAADDEAPRGAHRRARGQAGAPCRAHRGGANRGRSATRRAHARRGAAPRPRPSPRMGRTCCAPGGGCRA
jgi:hypothetical protein